MTRILTIIALLFATPMLAACASGGDTFVRVKSGPPIFVTLKEDVLYEGVEVIFKGTRYQLLENDDGQRFVWNFGPVKCPYLGGCPRQGLELDAGLCLNGVAVLGNLGSIFPLERKSLYDRRQDFSPNPCFSIANN